jgi:hypothetical protein
LLLVEDLAVSGHFVAAEADDICDAIVVGGHAALGQEFPLEKAFHAGALASAGRIGGMAAVAVIVVDTAAGGLLGGEAEFGVTLAALDVAAGKDKQCGGENEDSGFQKLTPGSRRLPWRRKYNIRARG